MDYLAEEFYERIKDPHFRALILCNDHEKYRERIRRDCSNAGQLAHYSENLKLFYFTSGALAWVTRVPMSEHEIYRFLRTNFQFILVDGSIREDFIGFLKNRLNASHEVPLSMYVNGEDII